MDNSLRLKEFFSWKTSAGKNLEGSGVSNTGDDDSMNDVSNVDVWRLRVSLTGKLRYRVDPFQPVLLAGAWRRTGSSSSAELDDGVVCGQKQISSIADVEEQLCATS